MICRRGRRRCSRGRAGRRLGCFRLPRVAGARNVIEARRKDAPWLARTDIDAREVEFSKHWDALTPTAKRYIALHEQAHLKTGERHDAAFYDELRRLTDAHRIPWRTAYELESWNCHAAH